MRSEFVTAFSTVWERYAPPHRRSVQRSKATSTQVLVPGSVPAIYEIRKAHAV